jgi:hypothetical protein
VLIFRQKIALKDTSGFHAMICFSGIHFRTGWHCKFRPNTEGRSGSVHGPGLSYNETVAHMTLWVMAASPLLACTDARCAFSDRKLHPRMPLVPTPARLKLLHACDQCHSSRVITPLTGWHCKLCPNTEGPEHERIDQGDLDQPRAVGSAQGSARKDGTARRHRRVS